MGSPVVPAAPRTHLGLVSAEFSSSQGQTKGPGSLSLSLSLFLLLLQPCSFPWSWSLSQPRSLSLPRVGGGGDRGGGGQSLAMCCLPHPKSRLVPAHRVTSVSLGHLPAAEPLGKLRHRKELAPVPRAVLGRGDTWLAQAPPNLPSPTQLPPGSGVGQQAGQRVMVGTPRQAGLVLALAGPLGPCDTSAAHRPRRGGQPSAPRGEQPGAEDDLVGGPGAVPRAPVSCSPHGCPCPWRGAGGRASA